MKNATDIFCNRMWKTKEEVYINRIRSLGFNNLGNILDAGAGCGQWSNALAKTNNFVDFVEPDNDRVLFAKENIILNNINYYTNRLENFNFKEEYYDGIFCYSVIYNLDASLILEKFYHALKTNGKIYICANNLEFYIYNILYGHNDNKYFNSRANAIAVIKNTISTFQNNLKKYPVIYSGEYISKKMNKIGFKNIKYANEGYLSGNGNESFYPAEKFGEKAVYEILASK